MADTTEIGDLTQRSKESIVNRGILEEHARKVGEYNRLKHWLIVFRPINSDVAKKLGEGYRGKVIFIKSKSSEFPPIGGDIPFEAELSKSFDKGKDTIDHFNQIAGQAVVNIRGDTKDEQDKNKKYKDDLEKKIENYRKELEIRRQELESKNQELESKNQELESKNQELESKNQELVNNEQELVNNEQELVNNEQELVNNEQDLKNIINALQQLESDKQQLEAKKQQLEAKKQQLESDKQQLESDKQQLESDKQQLESDKQQLEAKKQQLESDKQQLEAEIGEDERKLKNAINEYNLNFFLYKKSKTISISEEEGEFELHYRKINPAVNGHDVETEKVFELDENGNKVFLFEKDGKGNIKKDKYGKEIPVLRPVFYATKYNKCFKLLYNDKGSIIEKTEEAKSFPNDLKSVEIFTYSQFKINENGEILKHNPPLTADYDQLTAGSVYMTIDANQTDEKKMKLWKTIDYITGLQNNEFTENWTIIKGNLQTIQEFLPDEFRDKYLSSNNTTLNPESIKPNEIKEQIEYLKDSLFVPIDNQDLTKVNLKFCQSERDKLITYPADRYMRELRGGINLILEGDNAKITEIKAELIGAINEFKDNDNQKVKDFKESYKKDESLNDEGKIKTFLNEIDKLSENEDRESAATKLKEKLNKIIENKEKEQFKNNWTIIKENLQTIQEFLPDEFKDKYLPSNGENIDPNLIDIDEIKTQALIVSKKLGLLGTCSEAITMEKMAIGEILDYGISHGLEIQHFPPETIKRRGEEFLIADENGKVRVIDGLEGLLSNINYKKSRGIACLEVNPLWQIEKNENGDIVYSEKPNPIASIYGSLAGLQAITIKELTREQKKDFDPLGQYMYAERLYYNDDFVPYAQELKRQDSNRFQALKAEVTIDSLAEATTYYGKSIGQLKGMLGSKYLEDNFLDFCIKEPVKGLASYMENHEEITSLFKEQEIKNIFTNEESIAQLISNLESKKQELIDNQKQEAFIKSYFSNIKEDQAEKLTKVLFNTENNKFRELLTTKSAQTPKNLTRLFEVLPNLNLLKGLENGIEFKNGIEDSIIFMGNRKIDVESKMISEFKVLLEYSQKLKEEIVNINLKMQQPRHVYPQRQTLFAPITQEQELAEIRKENEIKERREEERNEIIKQSNDRLQKLKNELVSQEKKIKTWRDMMPSLTRIKVTGVSTGSSPSKGRRTTLAPMPEKENSNQGTSDRATSMLGKTKEKKQIIKPRVKTNLFNR